MSVSDTTLINAGVQAGLIDPQSLPSLKLEARRERIRLLEAVLRAGRFPQAALYQALAELRGMPFLLPRDVEAERTLLARLPAHVLERHPMVPVCRGDKHYLVLADPDDALALDAAQRATGCKLRPALAAPETLHAALRAARGTAGTFEAQAAAVDAVALFDDVMKEAHLRRATDVHFEPHEHGVHVRLRVDGRLQEFHRPLGRGEGEAVVSRIKVLANLDIAEQRLAQDGSLGYAVQGWNLTPVDVRVATIPTRWGERATLRLLGQGADATALEGLGMDAPMLAALRAATARPHGMLLVTGPTGSGKSTTLYAALHEIDRRELNVLTVEDPVEQIVAGISQVQVSNKVGFAAALRAFLRHDPDVILVGEIRDLETAETALKAAMTGHLVLSTLHTNDAAGAIGRLTDIGVPPYLVGATLIGIIAQRLVRRLCPHCRRRREANARERELLAAETGTTLSLYEASGCPLCLGTGFLGRTGLFESLWVDRALGEQIARGAREAQLRAAAGADYRTLWHDARAKVLAGITPLAEVERLIAPPQAAA